MKHTSSLDLTPARWIWFPGERTLPNTFVLFRRELGIGNTPVAATGWITADSRYRLTVNGCRVQWGPAPCDPRRLEADPVDLTPYLQSGENVIGVEVLYYGGGDGTYAMGAPGMLCRLELEYSDGRAETLVSDASWRCFLDRAHPPGQHRRWFLRALQEEFDARLHPHGWDTPAFEPNQQWLPARELPGAPSQPAIFAGGPEQFVVSDQPSSSAMESALQKRAIPLLDEFVVAARAFSAAGRVQWRRDPRDWFESRVPGSFEIERDDALIETTQDGWTLPATPDASQAVFATFEMEEQIVGWPRFTLDAPEGTIVELMTQESHDPNGPQWLDTHIFSWARFICREGLNTFETFDFESFRWLQLHVRGAAREVKLLEVGGRRRVYPWPHQAHIRCGEPALQRLFDAAVNTLNNSCQETCVDGMGRERQQYSGDGGHQVQAVRYAFGETRLPARFLQTFSQGQTLDGYFLDCWPAYDRLARLMQRQVGATQWGPLLDHGVGFNFDCWQHYLETGDLDAVREPYPRLLRFAEYLQALRGADGLLPVEEIGVPTVWMDHHAYQQQRHKQCAFNLYVAGAWRGALAPLARAFGDHERADHWEALAASVAAAAVKAFWCERRELFVNNLPWLQEEGEARLCDRSLAESILFDVCPDGQVAAAVQALDECPPNLGISYPCNAGWRYRALAQAGRAQVVVDDFRARWATMDSVRLNNTLQEDWQARPDSADQWSHCPLAPLFVLFTDLAGIRPAEPGFARCTVQPRLGDLGHLDVTAHTVRGPIRFTAQPQQGGHHVSLTLPADCQGELLLDAAQPAPDALPECGEAAGGLRRFALERGESRFFVARQ